jgi:hypothetical protein
MTHRKLSNTVPRVCSVILLAVSIPTVFAERAIAQDKECQSLMKQIDDLVDRVAQVSERIGTVECRMEHQGDMSPDTIQKNKHTLETDKSTLRTNKATIDKLLDKACTCCAKKSPGPASAQRHKECQALMKQIDDLVDRVAGVSERIGTVECRMEHQGNMSPDTIQKNKHTLETDKSTLRTNKATIDKLLDKLCTCCARETGAAQQPTPSTTDKVTDVLKTIGSSVSIGIGGGIGGGGGDRHGHHGEGGHRTAEKVGTGDKSRTTSTTSKKTTTGTGHKTVTAACKCHPCTCAPCTCH